MTKFNIVLWLKIVLTVLLAFFIFLLDYSIELGVAGGIPYVILVLSAFLYRDNRVVFLLGTAGVVLTVIGFFLSPDGGESWKILLNRFYAIGVISIVSFFVYKQKKSQERIEYRNKELEKSNKELEEFSYIAAHDLKAPMINLSTLTEMIDSETIVDEQNKELFNRLKKSIGKMHKTVFTLNDVIAFKTTLKEKNDRLNFKVLFNEIKESMAEQLKVSQANIIEDFSQCPETVYPTLHLHSVIQNLLTNAVKYRNPDIPLEIEIKTTKRSGRVCLSVKDNGLGFDAEKYEAKLWGLFTRMHTHVEGKGIGMYILKSIVEKHGGKVEVISKPNKGALFNVYLNK